MKNVLPMEGRRSPGLSGGIEAIALPSARRDRVVGGQKSGFETLIAELSGRLEIATGADLSEMAVSGLQMIGNHIGADRISLIEIGQAAGGGGIVCSQCSADADLRPLSSLESIRWLIKEMRQGTAHVLTTSAHLPPAASEDRRFLRSGKIESCIAAPLGQASGPDFALICESRQRARWWTVETLKRVTLAGRMIAGAIRRGRADQMIIELRGRLVEVKEGERKRIARELHDDVSQRMAHICLDLDRLKSDFADGASDLAEIADDLADRTRILSTDIGRICRELYPSRLEQTELTVAISNLCREFAERDKLDVEFEHKLGRKCISQETSFVLYRIAQEGLRNVVKHSGSDSAVVEIRSRRKGIEMLVTDTGRGFDMSKVASAGGLGLNSMRDRLQLIGGQMTIESHPGLGTRLDVWVPATAQRKSKGG